MAQRWIILAALTLARTTMGLQFQSVPAVAPHLVSELGFSYAGLGTFVGLYLLAGIFVALPGGWLGQRFGDKQVTLLGLGLMTAGGILIGVSQDHTLLNLGRILSGTGAVFLNVLLTKMVADWFAGREIVAAMGILIASWPLGIALAMVLLPTLAAAAGWSTAMFACALAAASCLILTAATYRPPDKASPVAATQLRIGLDRKEVSLAVVAGLIWTFYNAGLILVLAFGPDYLTSLGQGAIGASATISLVGWLVIPSIVAGGWLAQRAGYPTFIMSASFVFSLGLIGLLVYWGPSIWLVVLLGLAFGPAGPLIMVLPVEAVRPENRAVGMGLYFTCYYVGMTIAPPFAGLMRDLTGQPAVPVLCAALMLACALASLAGFRLIQRRPDPAAT